MWCESERLDSATLRFERLMLGIRLNEGLERSSVSIDPQAVATLVNRGWLEERSDRLTLTANGRHFCSEIVASIAGD